MRYYTVVARLSGALAGAVAVEWTNRAAPVDSGQGWEPCLRRSEGGWRFASHDYVGPAQPHRRAAGAFGDIAIRYRLEPAGPWSEAPAARKAIVILGDAGPDEAPVELAVPPQFLLAPTLAGAAEIGATLTIDPGAWSGTPAPALAFQWRRDGADVPGATGSAYVPRPEDDGAALDCRVTAMNAAGAAFALAGPLRVAWPAPRLRQAPAEAVLDEADGAARLEAAAVFEGGALAFVLAGAPEGVAIDPASGALDIPLGRPVAGARFTVMATNSGGTVSAEFVYTVRAVPPAAPDITQASLLRSVWRPEDQTVWFTPVVAFPGLPGVAAEDVQWTAAPNFEGADWDHNWHPVVAAGAGAFQLYASNHPVPAGETDPAVWDLTDAARLTQLRFRRRLGVGRSWSAASEPFTIPPAIVEAPPTVKTAIPNHEAVSGTRYSRDFKPNFASATSILEWEVTLTSGGTWMSVSQPGTADGGGVAAGAVPNSQGTVNVSVRARNSTGWSPATSYVLTRVAASTPLAKISDPPQISSTVGTTKTHDLSQHVSASAPITYSKVSGHSWSTIDASTGVITFAFPATPATGGTSNFVFRAETTSPAAQIDLSVTASGVPVSTDDPSVLLPMPTESTINTARALPKQAYSYFNYEDQGGSNRGKDGYANVLLAIAARKGHANAQIYCRDWLRDLCNAPFTQAGNKMPSGAGRTHMQHHMNMVFTAILMADTPAVWNQITASERNKIDLVIKGCAVSAAWQNSDANTRPSSTQCAIDGGNYGKNFQLNFTSPSRLMPIAFAYYMGGSSFGATAQAYLNNFDRAAFASLCQSAGLYDMHYVFSAVRGGGPSFTEFHNAVRNYKMNNRVITSLADCRWQIENELLSMWSGTIRAGYPRPSNYATDKTTPGVEWSGSDSVGLFERVRWDGGNWQGATYPAAPRTGQGRGAMVGRLSAAGMTAWNAINPAKHPYKGQVGQARALEGADAGGTLGPGGPRSSTIYAFDEYGNIVSILGFFAAIGLVDRGSARAKDGRDRMERGVFDLNFKAEYGYRNFAKGGQLYRNQDTTDDWDLGNASAVRFRIPVMNGLYYDVIKPYLDAA